MYVPFPLPRVGVVRQNRHIGCVQCVCRCQSLLLIITIVGTPALVLCLEGGAEKRTLVTECPRLYTRHKPSQPHTNIIRNQTKQKAQKAQKTQGARKNRQTTRECGARQQQLCRLPHYTTKISSPSWPPQQQQQQLEYKHPPTARTYCYNNNNNSHSRHIRLRSFFI